jgi:hypothetical protein
MVALAWLLVAGTFLGGVIYRFRRNDTGRWAALILLPPTALMYNLPLSYPTGGYELAQVLGNAVVVAALAGVVAAIGGRVLLRFRPAPDYQAGAQARGELPGEAWLSGG